MPLLHRLAGALLLLAPVTTEAQIAPGRWVGGLRQEDDYIAVVLHVRGAAGKAPVELAFPNRPERGHWLDRGQCTGSRCDLQERAPGALHLSLERAREGWQGSWRDGTDSGTVELVAAPDLDARVLRRLSGMYRQGDGSRVGIRVLPRVTDTLLEYLDEATGETGWLFPLDDSTFVAGPTFEMARPIRRTLILRPVARAPLAIDTLRLRAIIDSFLLQREACHRRWSESSVLTAWPGPALAGWRTSSTTCRRRSALCTRLAPSRRCSPPLSSCGCGITAA